MQAAAGAAQRPAPYWHGAQPLRPEPQPSAAMTDARQFSASEETRAAEMTGDPGPCPRTDRTRH